MVSASPELRREIWKAMLYVLIAAIGLAVAIRGGVGWGEHGFHAPSRHGLTSGEDGSFSLLLLGASFFFYGVFGTHMAIFLAREAARRDDSTQDI